MSIFAAVIIVLVVVEAVLWFTILGRLIQLKQIKKEVGLKKIGKYPEVLCFPFHFNLMLHFHCSSLCEALERGLEET